MKRVTKNAGKILDEFFERAPRPPQEQLQLSRRNILNKFDLESTSQKHLAPLPSSRSGEHLLFQFAFAAAALAIAIAGGIVIFRAQTRVPSAAVAEASNGFRYGFGETVRSAAESGMFLMLADGSRIEMRSQSVLRLESAIDGVRIRLHAGGVIVSAAKQRTGHLYVQTKDVVVSVVGTAFLVNAEEEGSRVAVIQGEVRVQQGTLEKKLLPGEQVATNPVMLPMPVPKEIAWSREAELHLALLQQAVALAKIAPPLPPASQDADIPKWETVSIKPCNDDSRPPGVRGAGPRPSPGRLFLECMTVQQMIGMYTRATGDRLLNASRGLLNIFNDGTESLKNAPSWVRSDKWMIDARTEGTPETKVMEGPMTRAILEDRFQLKLHKETEEVPMYAMTVAKGGLKIQPVELNDCRKFRGEKVTPEQEWAMARSGEKPFCGTVNGGTHGPNIVWYFGGQTLENFANIISGNVDRHVLDKTGIPGNFIIFLEFMRDDNAGPLFGAAPTDISDIQPGPSIMTAIEELGLKLEPTKGPREFLVMDHVEKPSEN
jgi:uncharacterized protein (TIGR03435 family)